MILFSESYMHHAVKKIYIYIYIFARCYWNNRKLWKNSYCNFAFYCNVLILLLEKDKEREYINC